MEKLNHTQQKKTLLSVVGAHSRACAGGSLLRASSALLVVLCFSSASSHSAHAQSWKRIATDTTLTNNQLCKTDGTNIICDTTTPTIVSGLVGIGTTSPQTTLQVNGSIMMGTGTCSASTPGSIQYSGGAVQFCNGTSWANISSGGGGSLTGSIYQVATFSATNTATGNTNITTDSSSDFIVGAGKLAIGTTTVSTAISLSGAAAQTIGMANAATGNNLTLQAGGTSGGTNASGGNLVLASGGTTGTGTSSIVFNTYPPGSSGTTANTAMTALAVSATGVAGTTAATAVQAGSGSGLNKNGNNLLFASGASTGTGTSVMQFNVYGAGTSGSTANTPTTAMTIASTGNVAIGTTATPESLTVTQSANGPEFDAGIEIFNSGSGGYTTQFLVGNSGSNEPKQFRISDGTTNRFGISSSGSVILQPTSGNVGIGTISPADDLQVYDANTPAYGVTPKNITIGRQLNQLTSGGGIDFEFDWTAAGGNRWYTQSRIVSLDTAGYGGNLAFYTKPTDGSYASSSGGSGTDTSVERMRIDNNGYVMIGTTAQINGALLTVNYNSGVANGLTLNNTASSGHSWALGDGVGASCPAGTFCFADYTAGSARMVMNSSGYIGIGSNSPVVSLDLSTRTDAVSLPAGTTSNRPPTGVNGMIRYNATATAIEGFVNGSWTSLTGTSGASTNFSAPTSETIGTIYPPSSAGIVTAYETRGSTTCNLVGKVGTSSPPTTVVDSSTMPSTAGGIVSVTFPVSNTEYYEVVATCTGGTLANMYYTPITGSGGSGGSLTGAQYQVATFTAANAASGNSNITTDAGADLIVSTGNIAVGTATVNTAYKIEAAGNPAYLHQAPASGGTSGTTYTDVVLGATAGYADNLTEIQTEDDGGTATVSWWGPRWGNNYQWNGQSSTVTTIQGAQISVGDSGASSLTLYDNTNANPSATINTSTQNVFITTNGYSYFNGGNVGINTTNPQVELDVTGSVATNAVGTEDEFHITRSLNGGYSFPQVAAFQLGSYAANSSGNNYGPSTRLDINLKAAANSTLTGDTNIMTLLSSGNVGIGTSDPTLGGALISGAGITIVNSNTAVAAAYSGSQASFALNPLSNGAWSMSDHQSGSWVVGLSQKAGNVGFGTASPIRAITDAGEFSMVTAGTSYFDVSDSGGNNGNTMSLDIRGLASGGSAEISLASIELNAVKTYIPGNVGIGTSDPTLGGALISGAGITIVNSNTAVAAAYSGSQASFALNPLSNGAWSMSDHQSGSWVVGLSQKAGNVGFGTASPIRAITDAGEFSMVTAGTSYFDVSDSGGNNGNTMSLDIRGLASGGSAEISLASIELNAVKTYIPGNVGIGTASPNALLDIAIANGGVYWNEILRNSNNANTTGYGAGLKLKNSSDTGTEANKWAGIAAVAGSAFSNDTDLAFYTDASSASAPVEAMRLTGSGSVGLGTTTPGSVLDIEGTSSGSNLFKAASSGYHYTAIDNFGSFNFDNNIFIAYDNTRTSDAVTTNSFPLYLTTDGYGGSNNNIIIFPNGTGEVGVGTTSPAANTLMDVRGMIASTARVSNGTFPTITGCGTPGSPKGGTTTGTFTAGSATCAPAITALPTAPNGWWCSVTDMSATANVFVESSNSTTSCTFTHTTGTVATGNTLIFHAEAY